jgi:hypothetical protein
MDNKLILGATVVALFVVLVAGIKGAADKPRSPTVSAKAASEEVFPFGIRDSISPPAKGLAEGGGIAQPTLDEQLQRSRRLRVFYEKALLNPTQGGIYFAQNAGFICSSLQAAFQQADARATGSPLYEATFGRNAVQVQLAREELLRRCDGLIGLGPTSSRYKELRELEKGRTVDPLAHARWLLSVKPEKSRDEQVAAIKTFLELRGSLSSSMLYFDDTKLKNQSSVWFDGKKFGGVTPTAFSLALAAAQMEVRGLNGLSNPGEQTLEELEICATWGVCNGSALDRVLFDVPPGSGIRMEASALMGSLRDALLQRDASRFLPPDGGR